MSEVIKGNKSPKGAVNFMLLLMEAVAKDQKTLSKTQITDAETAQQDATFEEKMYEHWNGVLQNDCQNIQYAKGTRLQRLQAKYSADSTEASAEEQQMDGSVRAAQGQTSADASNLQMKAQMAQGIQSILTSLSSMLGRIV